MKKRGLMLCIVLVFTVVFTSCSITNNNETSSEIFVMNTYVSQKVYGKNNQKAIEKVNATLVKLDKQLSLYQNGSDIDSINKNAGVSAVKVDGFTYNLIKTAVEYCTISQGTFDITIAPLTTLWGINSENPKVPSPDDIAAALALVNYRDIIFNDSDKSIMLAKKGMSIDLGGIAKGYICQQIKEDYDLLNVDSAIVSIGGNIYAYKLKPNGSMFTLGIRDPLGGANDTIGKLKCSDKVVATTGEYERFFEQNGVKYHHILSTETGYPVSSDLLSVTIVSENGGLADFLSTTLFIAGKANINKYLNQTDFSVIVIDSEKNVYISDAIKNDFEITNNDYHLAR